MLFPFLQMSKPPGRILAQDRTSVKCQGPLRLRTIRPSRHADVFWDEDSSALLLSESFFPSVEDRGALASLSLRPTLNGCFFLGLCRAVAYTLGPRVLVPGEDGQLLSWDVFSSWFSASLPQPRWRGIQQVVSPTILPCSSSL